MTNRSKLRFFVARNESLVISGVLARSMSRISRTSADILFKFYENLLKQELAMFCVLYACSVEKRKILKPGLVNQRINI